MCRYSEYIHIYIGISLYPPPSLYTFTHIYEMVLCEVSKTICYALGPLFGQHDYICIYIIYIYIVYVFIYMGDSSMCVRATSMIIQW